MKDAEEVKLPPPRKMGEVSVEEAIARRSSVRSYTEEPLSLNQVSQLLWAAQGITHGGRFRAAPSAGATYPLELFVVAGSVDKLEPGIYRYDVNNHSLHPYMEGDQRQRLADASLGQGFIAQAPIDIVICAIYGRTTDHYGQRGVRYVHIDTGHAAENLSLQAVALGLATVMVGAFHDDEVSSALCLAEELKPLYIIPVGKER